MGCHMLVECMNLFPAHTPQMRLKEALLEEKAQDFCHLVCLACVGT